MDRFTALGACDHPPVDEVYGAAHVDVHKVAVNLLLHQLGHAGHLGRAAAAHLSWCGSTWSLHQLRSFRTNLDPEEVLGLVALGEGPLRPVALQQLQPQRHLAAGDVHTQALAHSPAPITAQYCRVMTNHSSVLYCDCDNQSQFSIVG